MKLGLKMLVAPLLVAAVSLGAAAVYGVVDYAEGQKAAAADNADLRALKVAGQAQETLSQMRGSVYRTLALMASLDDAKIKAARAELRGQGEGLKTRIAGLATGATDTVAAKLVEGAGARLADFVSLCDKAIDLSTVDPNVGTGSMRAAEDVYAHLADDLQGLLAHEDGLRSLREKATQERRLRLTLAMALALLAAGGLAGWVSWRVQRRLVDELRQAVALSEAVARGDLAAASRTPATDADDEIGELTRALLGMVQGLEASLQTVRQATDHIGTASGEIASGNQDLSGRTEQTASNLQQAASSLEQLTGTVRQTADSARTANQLAAS
ncbi:MAG: hypothetical protein KGI90_17775, partial [Burkholderiales bacterium]|nr:hypothetical protein [Burkholderiales bacterium]